MLQYHCGGDLMIIYKITNKLNGKVYIGQTRYSLAKRKSAHIKCVENGVDRHLYNAMRKYGIENFVFEEIDHADTLTDLNYLEAYYITKYDSVRKGYNMGYGGDNNVMFSDVVKQKHDNKMRSKETRLKISNTMKKYRKENPFTEEHRKHLSESAMGNHNFGNPDTRSIGCYCILENGERYDFHSYRDAWKWWITIDNPFDTEAECIYQRKIKQSIKLGYFTYGRSKDNKYFYPKWFRKGGDAK